MLPSSRLLKASQPLYLSSRCQQWTYRFNRMWRQRIVSGISKQSRHLVPAISCSILTREHRKSKASSWSTFATISSRLLIYKYGSVQRLLLAGRCTAPWQSINTQRGCLRVHGHSLITYCSQTARQSFHLHLVLCWQFPPHESWTSKYTVAAKWGK